MNNEQTLMDEDGNLVTVDISSAVIYVASDFHSQHGPSLTVTTHSSLEQAKAALDFRVCQNHDTIQWETVYADDECTEICSYIPKLDTRQYGWCDISVTRLNAKY